MNRMIRLLGRVGTGSNRRRKREAISSSERTIRSNLERLGDGRKLHVALTGTSNSILVDGFSAGIRTHPRVGLFQNKSIGASGTIAIAAHLRDLQLTNYQYLFIDYCVNETYFVHFGIEKLENVYRQMAALIDHAARQGCLPVIVYLPVFPAAGKVTPVPVMLEKEFVSRGVPMFNAQSMVESFARSRGLDVRELFLDEAHLRKPLAREIGRCLVDLLERTRQAGAIDVTAQRTDATYGGIGYIPADALVTNGTATIERSNNLLRVRLLPVKPGETITIPSPAGGQRHILRGVAYNATRSVGSLVSEEEEDVLLDIGRANYFGKEKDLLLINRPSKFPERPISDEIRIVCRGVKPKRTDKHPLVLEIAGINTHDPNNQYPLHTIAVSEGYRNLNDVMNDEDLARFGAVWDELRLEPSVAPEQGNDRVARSGPLQGTQGAGTTQALDDLLPEIPGSEAPRDAQRGQDDPDLVIG